MFVGREQELKFFDEKYSARGAQLIVLYGRRRIGKTELLRRFCEGKPHVFYSCREIPDEEQLRAFSERVLRAGSPAARYVDRFRDWESALNGFAELPAGGAKKLLVIDEFPYMCRSNPSIPSILQVLWDEVLKKKDIMIILCGSAMSFLEKKVLSEKSPLYGRATGIYKLGELPFDDASKFFPKYSAEDKVLAWSILGGIPHYLRQFDPALSLRENIVKNVLTKGCVLYSEVEFLIRQELREAAMYNTIIEVVAFGNTQLNDIYTKTQIDRAKISVYLKNLIDLGIIEREFSALAGTTEKSTSSRGLYRITDSFFRFWFRFVAPNISELEDGDAEGVFEHMVLPHLSDFAASAFEAVCHEFIRKKNRAGELPFRVAKQGRWWGKVNKPILGEDGKQRLTAMDAEVDILAVDEKMKCYILGECKFRKAKTDVADFENLREKSAFVKKGEKIYFAMFSKSGFAKSLSALAEKDESVLLFSLTDILG